jgi:hypothetical protein
MAGSSAAGKKLFEVCKAFYELASQSVSRKVALSTGSPDSAGLHVAPGLNHELENQPSKNLGSVEESSYEHIMVPQDWDAMMGEFESGTGVGAMASFVEPYMPFDWPYPSN